MHFPLKISSFNFYIMQMLFVTMNLLNMATLLYVGAIGKEK